MPKLIIKKQIHGFIILFILIFLLALSLLSLSLFKDNFFLYKLSNDQHKSLDLLYKMRNCTYYTLREFSEISKPIVPENFCQTLSCVHTFSPLNYEHLPYTWWKKEGFFCEKDIYIYNQFINSVGDTNFYEINTYSDNQMIHLYFSINQSDHRFSIRTYRET